MSMMNSKTTGKRPNNSDSPFAASKRRRTVSPIKEPQEGTTRSYRPKLHDIVVRDFGLEHGVFVGWIEKCWEEDKHDPQPLWRVKYEDGDVDDFNLEELQKYVQTDTYGQHFGQFYSVAFPPIKALGVVIAPHATNTPKDSSSDHGGVEAEKIRREKSVVVKTKDACVGRGLLTRFDEVRVISFRSELSNLPFKENVNALRCRAEDKPLSVIFKRKKENISLRVATYERCSALFKRVCNLWRKASPAMVEKAKKLLGESSGPNEKAVAPQAAPKGSDKTDKGMQENDEYCPLFFELLLTQDLKALFFHHAPTNASDTSDVERTEKRFMRLLSIMEKVQSSSNGLDEKSKDEKVSVGNGIPTASKQPTQQAVATNQAKTNMQKRKLANASVAVAAAAARNGPTRRDPSANFKKGTVQAGVASLPQHVLDDTKRKFLLIRQQLIQTPSHQIFDTVVEPAHTQWLCVGNIPVCIPQVGMHVWAFMDDINEIRKLGLPTNEKTKIGYYRAVIVGIQSGGNFIRVHWLSLGINNVDQNWYNIKRLRLWRPAATAVALFVFLESGGKHMITMPVNSQHQMLTRYCSLREALQRRYEAARTVSQRSFADAPMVSLADINYNFCITFPLETLGIGIDVEHSDGGIKVTSIHGSPNNPELHQAMQNIRPGDRIVAVRKQTPNGSNLTYTTINRDLKQLIGFVQTAGRPIQMFFLRGENLPYARHQATLQTIYQAQQGRPPAVQIHRPIMQQRQQQNLEWIRKKQMQAQRQAQTSRMQSVQPQAHAMVPQTYSSSSYNTNGKVNTSMVGNVSKQHVNAAQNQLEVMRKNCENLENKVKEAYTVVEETNVHVKKLEKIVETLTSADTKEILRGVSERFTDVGIALSNMNGDELKRYHDTFVLPYYALKEKSKTNVEGEISS